MSKKMNLASKSVSVFYNVNIFKLINEDVGNLIPQNIYRVFAPQTEHKNANFAPSSHTQYSNWHVFTLH